MKVLQFIDSLQPGGAERMAVTLANELSRHGFESHICVSRSEGMLKESILPEVSYLFLKKRNALDFAGIRRIHNYIKKNGIEVVHAHSSSFFWATLLKKFNPNLTLIWHDHYGNSEAVKDRKFRVLRYCSSYFDGIISVNEKLMEWAGKHLHCQNVKFVRNFVSSKEQNQPLIELPGDPEMRIVCLANLRPQKDHLNLLSAFEKVQKNYDRASLHLIGKEIHLDYFEKLKHFVKEHRLEQVHFHGAQRGVQPLLQQAKIGVLSSNSEGLPVALLEYGITGLPVVCTDVGQCKEVISGNGKVVPPGNSIKLAEAILFYLSNPKLAQADSERFKQQIEKNYSFQAILPDILEMYNS